MRYLHLPQASVAILGVALTIPSLFAQHQFPPPPVQAAPSYAPGIEFPYIGHQVADLDRSIHWFTSIHFKVVEGPTPWTVDEALNQLGNTAGAESRSAVLKILGSGDQPFTLVLHQYRGIAQQNWSKPDPSQTIDRNIGTNARAFLIDLGLVTPPEPRDPAHPGLAKPALPGGEPSAAPVNPEDVRASLRALPRPCVLGAGPARIEDLDGFAFNGNVGCDQNLRVQDSAGRPAFTPETAQFQDINANYASFQVRNLDAVYAKAKEDGAITVTKGGIVNYNNGRAVVIRDPYADSFIMLWQPAQ